MTELLTIAEALHAAAAAVLSDDPDRAANENGVGYSKSDGSLGRAIAAVPPAEWDAAFARTAWLTLRKYRRQLADRHGIDFAAIPEPKVLSDDRADGDRGHVRAVAAPKLAAAGARQVAADSRVDLIGDEYVVTLAKYDPKLVSAVKAIPGRKWNGKSNVLPASSALRVAEFAEEYGLALTDAAADAIAVMVEAMDATSVAEAVAAYKPVIKVSVDSEGFVVDLPYELNERRFTLKSQVGPRFDGTAKVWRTAVSSANAAKLLAWCDSQTDIEVTAEARTVMESEAVAAVKKYEASMALDADITIPTLKAGMDLRPFQKGGVKYAHDVCQPGGKGAILGDEMGLGKTPEGLGLVVYRQAFPAVIVVPMAVAINWAREVPKFFDGYSVLAVEGTIRGDIPDGYHFYIVPDSIIGDRWEDVAALYPKALIADELHRFKNGNRQSYCPDCGKAKGVRSDTAKCPNCYCEIKDRVQYRWTVKRTNGLLQLRDAVAATVPDPTIAGLTGTLVTNRNIEVINPLYFVGWLDEFGGEWGFKMRYCNPPEAPIWMGDMRFKPLGEVVVGDEVIGWEPGQARRRLTKATVVKVMRRTAPIVKITLASGKVIRCTADHRWLSGRSFGKGNREFFITPAVGRKLVKIIEPTAPVADHLRHAAGWLGGLYDGEGTGERISQHEVANPAVCKRIVEVMTDLDIPYTPLPDEGFFLTGGRQAYVDFLNKCRPVKSERLERKILSTRFRQASDEIVAIDPDGEGEVISMTTTTGNYVAWGYASKNCGAERTDYGWTFKGSSNTDELHERLRMTCYLRRNKLDVIKDLPDRVHAPRFLEVAAKGRAVYRSTEADVIAEIGERAMAKAQAEIAADADILADVEATAEEKAVILRKRNLASVEDFTVEGELLKVNWEARARAGAAEHLVRIALLKKVATEAKMESVYGWLDEFFEDDAERKIVVFAENIDVVEGIAAHYGDKAVKYRGGMSKEDKQVSVDRFQEDPAVKLFVANLKSGSEGITLTAASDVAFVQFGWTPGIHDQAIDRCYGRINDAHGAVGHYLLMAGTIEEDIFDLVNEKRKVTDAVNAGRSVDPDAAEVGMVGELAARLIRRAGLPGQDTYEQGSLL